MKSISVSNETIIFLQQANVVMQRKKAISKILVQQNNICVFIKTPIEEIFLVENKLNHTTKDVFFEIDIDLCIQFLKLCTNPEIIEKENTIDISSKKRKMSLQKKAQEEITLPEVPKQGIKFKKDTLSMVLKNIAWISGKEVSKQFLRSVFYTKNSLDEGVYVATDGFRLGMFIDNKHNLSYKDIILPNELLFTLEKIVQDEFSLYIDKNFIYAWNDTFFYKHATVSETYPQYEKVIPEIESIILTFYTKDLLDSIKAAMLSMDEKSVALVIENNQKEDIMTVRPKFPEGKANYSVLSSVFAKNKEAFTKIAINPHYLQEVLQKINTETVTFFIHKENTPILIVPDTQNTLNEAKQKTLFYILMPVRLQELE